jgi:peptidoglycan/xylan/chitin deacetylase (PgdA/CDA1 family)
LVGFGPTVHAVHLASEANASCALSTAVPVMVHGVGRAGHELDPGEDQIWVSVAQFERVLDVVAKRPDVRITFDDGNASDVEVALPRLVERGLNAEFFLLAGVLGERDGSTPPVSARCWTPAWRSGRTGWSHRDWRRIDNAQARGKIGRRSPRAP